ncbi:transporter substrate-binding domain-containing protein [Micrococcus sp. EYE_162]|uniref:transporter substrate-binding domain-containing protein n=1 Tax=unclassified Micrococcus TaxID=2620948 RepID=UPI0020051772|nr:MULTISPECIES: transporter substrate-binding domain-containing protein [unclassified Micrococcus]MCK6095148.1 transporter substrate-binding domain-containing protein [Micrococcus sp. EYE_212]MCK6171095.1 transporter substrate-binding domain-containing protein [Micrococcus sp. EYE_162]
METTRRLVVSCLLATAGLGLTGCTSSGYPADPEGTLDRITGGVLRAGAAHHPPYVDVTGAEPTGSEADLVRRFAQSRGASVEWTASGEEALMTALEKGDLDIAVGGFTERSPWTTHANLTRPYAEVTGPDGEDAKLVMAVPLGENQMLGALERFLDEQPQEDRG